MGLEEPGLVESLKDGFSVLGLIFDVMPPDIYKIILAVVGLLILLAIFKFLSH